MSEKTKKDEEKDKEAYSSEEEKEIRERLKSLGYI